MRLALLQSGSWQAVRRQRRQNLRMRRLFSLQALALLQRNIILQPPRPGGKSGRRPWQHSRRPRARSTNLQGRLSSGSGSSSGSSGRRASSQRANIRDCSCCLYGGRRLCSSSRVAAVAWWRPSGREHRRRWSSTRRVCTRRQRSRQRTRSRALLRQQRRFRYCQHLRGPRGSRLQRQHLQPHHGMARRLP